MSVMWSTLFFLTENMALTGDTLFFFCACSLVVHTLFSMVIHALQGEEFFLASIALISVWAQFFEFG